MAAALKRRADFTGGDLRALAKSSEATHRAPVNRRRQNKTVTTGLIADYRAGEVF
jgi:hypothetical protein